MKPKKMFSTLKKAELIEALEAAQRITSGYHLEIVDLRKELDFFKQIIEAYQADTEDMVKRVRESQDKLMNENLYLQTKVTSYSEFVEELAEIFCDDIIVTRLLKKYNISEDMKKSILQ